MTKSSRLIKANDLTPAPWKNGGGVTFEVAISPASAHVSKLDFDWRVSIAQVDMSGPFSEFPGYDRKLVVWKGSGLKINDTKKIRMEPFAFNGETPIQADLINEPIKDFGVIYRRGLECDMQAKRIAEDAEATVDTETGDVFVLCASGEVRIEGFYLNPGDLYQGTGAIKIKALDRAEIVIIHIDKSKG